MPKQDLFQVLYANEKGEVLEDFRFSMLGRSGREWVEPAQENDTPAAGSCVGVRTRTDPGCYRCGANQSI